MWQKGDKNPTSGTVGPQAGKPENMAQFSNNKVAQMFQQIMTNINDMKTELKELKEDKTSNETSIKAIQQEQTAQNTEVELLKKENKMCKKKLNQLADELQHNKHVVNELYTKMQFLEKDKLRPNLIISGIQENKDENCIAVVKNFFKNELSLVHDVQIRRAHRLGKGKFRPIKVILQNADDKGLIYSNVKKLQGKKGCQ